MPLLLNLLSSKYLWWAAGLALAVYAAVSYVHGVEQKGYDQAKAECVAANAKAVAAKQQEQNAKYMEAINAEKQRTKKLSADRDNLRAANAGLQHDLEAYRGRLYGLSANATSVYASALSNVFGECVQRYADLAKEADEIDSERQTLIDAWPK